MGTRLKSDQILQLLDVTQLSQCEREVASYTREKMYILRHIPAKYLLPPALGDEDQHGEHLRKLVREMERAGCICLDREGEPACLSGKPAVLTPDGKVNHDEA